VNSVGGVVINPAPRSSAVPNRAAYIDSEPPIQKATVLSVDDVEESEEENKAVKRAQRKFVEPGAESREEAGSEETVAEIAEDSDDDAEELEEQESEEI
jgi:protein-disulfide isomerase-like protein with CxxC motif